MGRHFIQMGPRSSRASFGPASATLLGVGNSFNATSVLLGGTGQALSAGGASVASGSATLLGGSGILVPRSMAIARSALFTAASGSIGLLGSAVSTSPQTGINWDGNPSGRRAIVFSNVVGNSLNMYPATYIWKVYQRQQVTSGTLYDGSRFYTNFFWGNNGAFVWGANYFNSYYGAHPYPHPDGLDDNGKFEIAANASDIVTRDNGSEPFMAVNQWYSQAFVVQSTGGSNRQHRYYVDLPSVTTANRITYTPAIGQTNPPSPVLIWGQAPDPWGGFSRWEEQNGIIRGVQVYNVALSEAHVVALSALETDAQVLAYCAANGISTGPGASGLWYLNMNWRVADISDKGGGAHHPAWVTTNGESAEDWSSAPAEATWSGAVPSISFIQGAGSQTHQLSQYVSNFDPSDHQYEVKAGSPALPTGVSLSATTGALTYNGTAPVASTSNIVITIADLNTPANDWLNRISGAGVVWYHNFDSAAEVNQFRWTGGYQSGNDPQGLGNGAQYLTHVASGGADGGGFLRARYPAGSASGRGNSYWWRPYNPLTGATNGRGVNDPGANGTITPVAFNSSNGSSTLSNWSGSASNPGWYMHPSHQAQFPGKSQGHDFYLQVRVRRAQMPGAPPDSGQFQSITGKHVWLSSTVLSFTSQELVTAGQSVGNGDQVGVPSRHIIYVGQSFWWIDEQDDEGFGPDIVVVSNQNVNWRFSGGWDTLLYHVIPGTNGGTGTNRQKVEVWAQRDLTLFPAEAGLYTKIWDVTYTQTFDLDPSHPTKPALPGYNAFIFGCYHNDSAFSTQFDFDYDQVIFSKQTIPAPTT